MKKEKKRKTPAVVIFAVCAMALVLLFVSVNTAVLSRTIKRIEDRVYEAEISAEVFEEIYEEFLSVRTYLGITVDHNDIATVEEEFAEIRGALSIDDKETAAIAKSRLHSALLHLRRLSSFNLDSII